MGIFTDQTVWMGIKKVIDNINAKCSGVKIMGGAFLSENENHIYIAIDLKSFYASVECKERDLDPLTTNLVVADAERTEKTICLAVSPSLKAYGIPGRARLFEVVQRVKEVNQERMQKLPKECLREAPVFQTN